MAIQASIVTVGDKYITKEVKDEAGEVLSAICVRMGWNIVKRETLSDNEEQLAAWLTQEADSGSVDFILTLDGIGVKSHERVPEAMYQVCEKWLPGVAEIIRARAYENTPFVTMTRGLAGIRGRTLLINLPGGSPTAIKDAFEVLKPIVRQAVDQIKGLSV